MVWLKTSLAIAVWLYPSTNLINVKESIQSYFKNRIYPFEQSDSNTEVVKQPFGMISIGDTLKSSSNNSALNIKIPLQDFVCLATNKKGDSNSRANNNINKKTVEPQNKRKRVRQHSCNVFSSGTSPFDDLLTESKSNADEDEGEATVKPAKASHSSNSRTKRKQSMANSNADLKMSRRNSIQNIAKELNKLPNDDEDDGDGGIETEEPLDVVMSSIFNKDVDNKFFISSSSSPSCFDEEAYERAFANGGSHKRKRCSKKAVGDNGIKNPYLHIFNSNIPDVEECVDDQITIDSVPKLYMNFNPKIKERRLVNGEVDDKNDLPSITLPPDLIGMSERPDSSHYVSKDTRCKLNGMFYGRG